MPGEARGMRPLTISERGVSTLYGLIPAAMATVLLRIIFALIYVARTGTEVTLWEFVRYAIGFSAASTGLAAPAVENTIHQVMGHGMYAVFYFTYGRSLGHMLVKAHIVHAGTGRRLRTWQKIVRSLLQIANGYGDLRRMLDILSIIIVIIDRPRRRSVYDLLSGTVVIVGDPVAEEPETARQRNPGLLARLLGRQPSGA